MRTYTESRMPRCSRGDSRRSRCLCCTGPRWRRAHRRTGSLVPTGRPGNLGEKKAHKMLPMPCSVPRQLQISAVTLKNSKIIVKLSRIKDCCIISTDTERFHSKHTPVLQHARTHLKRYPKALFQPPSLCACFLGWFLIR